MSAVKNESKDPDGSTTASAKENSKKPVVKTEGPCIPSWLCRPGGEPVIRHSDIDAARNYHEAVNGNKFSKRMAKISRGASPSREDDSMHAMIKLYTAMSDIMQGTRRYFPNEFFLQVGYLFEDWSKYSELTISKDSVKVFWVVPSTEFVTPKYEEVTIPDSITRLSDPETVDKENEVLFRGFAETRSELELIVQHPVWVRKNGRVADQRNHPGDDRRDFCRTVNLMDVAGFICRTICAFPHQEVTFFKILKYHKKSISCLYHFALVLRDVLQHVGNEVIADVELVAHQEELADEVAEDKHEVENPAGNPSCQEKSPSQAAKVSTRNQGGGIAKEISGEVQKGSGGEGGNSGDEGVTSGDEEKARAEVLEVFVELFTPNMTNKKRFLKRVIMCVAEERYNLEHKEYDHGDNGAGSTHDAEDDGDESGNAQVAPENDACDPDDCVVMFD